MAYVISGACIGCGACMGECPMGAISEENGVCVINDEACIECGACAGACPLSAIEEK